MRLAKYLAHAGVASRRASEGLIVAGRVEVDGTVVTDPALTVPDPPADPPVIAVDGRVIDPPLGGEREVWAVNKPAGVVSTASDTHGRPTVVELVPRPGRRLYPVGRLDVATTGLILLTDDGELANLLIHPRHEVPKTYLVTVAGNVTPGDLRRLREGVMLDDGPTAPAGARLVEPGVIEIVLCEGRKRQVRRMCAAIGHPARELRRVAFGPLTLGDLPEGVARRLGPAEVERLRAAATPHA